MLLKRINTNDTEMRNLLEENQRLRDRYSQLEQKERALRVINEFASSILLQNTVDDIMWAIAKHAIAQLGFVDCVVYLADWERGILIQKAAHGPKNPVDFTIINRITIPIGEGVVGTVAKTGNPELIMDTSIDPRYIVDDAMRLSEIAVPIIIDGKVVGVIDSEHPDRGFYTPEHLRILRTVALMAASRLINAFAREELENYKNGLEELVQKRTDKLNKVIGELQDSNRDLEEYAYAASHDLKEPLRTISSFLNLVQAREKDLSESSQEFIAFAVDGAQRMDRLLNGLLEYSRVNSSRQQVEEVDLNVIMHHVLRNLSFTIRETGAVIDYPDHLPSLQGYPELLQQLFQNLIANSIKFRKEGETPHIRISYEGGEEGFTFEFQDNGIGIESEYAEAVFGLFTRLHTQDVYQGSGLGLSICKRIVQKHHGKIRMVSEGLGKGCLFRFNLTGVTPP